MKTTLRSIPHLLPVGAALFVLAAGAGRGLAAGPQPEIFASGGYTSLADTTQTAPGQGTAFNRFNNPAQSGSSVAFAAFYNANAGEGVYTGTVGVAGVTRLADYSTTAPGQGTPFSSFSNPVLSGPNVAVYGNYASGNGAGIYTGTVGTAGATRLADTSTTAPGRARHLPPSASPL